MRLSSGAAPRLATWATSRWRAVQPVPPIGGRTETVRYQPQPTVPTRLRGKGIGEPPGGG